MPRLGEVDMVEGKGRARKQLRAQNFQRLDGRLLIKQVLHLFLQAIKKPTLNLAIILNHWFD